MGGGGIFGNKFIFREAVWRQEPANHILQDQINILYKSIYISYYTTITIKSAFVPVCVCFWLCDYVFDWLINFFRSAIKRFHFYGNDNIVLWFNDSRLFAESFFFMKTFIFRKRKHYIPKTITLYCDYASNDDHPLTFACELLRDIVRKYLYHDVRTLGRDVYFVHEEWYGYIITFQWAQSIHWWLMSGQLALKPSPRMTIYGFRVRTFRMIRTQM